jgi:hypothetical protein
LTNNFFLCFSKHSFDLLFHHMCNFLQAGAKVSDIVSLMCIRNTKGPYRHYLSTTLSNLSQLQCIRDELLLRTDPLITSLFIFTEHSDIKRRGGVIGTIRNCTFDTSYHKWLLESIDILPRILLPLAGPTPETFVSLL